MWKTFFEELGVQVVTSGKTTRQIVDNGVREALADACMPVKVYFGHVMALSDHMGESYRAFEMLLNDLGNEVILPPRPSRNTINLGVQHAPEFACFL